MAKGVFERLVRELTTPDTKNGKKSRKAGGSQTLFTAAGPNRNPRGELYHLEGVIIGIVELVKSVPPGDLRRKCIDELIALDSIGEEMRQTLDLLSILPSRQQPPFCQFRNKLKRISCRPEPCIIRHNATQEPGGITDVELCHIDAVGLFRVCAADRENSEAWSEFLRRYSGKIKLFIRGTLRHVFGYLADPRGSSASILYQERDLFQNAIIRLVENDCAVMKKFSGESENELLAYLAVICRSSVLDCLRRNKAYKRRRVAFWEKSLAAPIESHRPTDRSESERGILVKELIALAGRPSGFIPAMYPAEINLCSIFTFSMACPAARLPSVKGSTCPGQEWKNC